MASIETICIETMKFASVGLSEEKKTSVGFPARIFVRLDGHTDAWGE